MPKIPFDDWLNDRLQEHNSPIDIDMEWEALAPIVATKKKDNRKIVFLLLLFVGMSTIGYIWNINEQEDSLKHSPVERLEPSVESQNPIATRQERLTDLLPSAEPNSGSMIQLQEIDVVDNQERLNIESEKRLADPLQGTKLGTDSPIWLQEGSLARSQYGNGEIKELLDISKERTVKKSFQSSVTDNGRQSKVNSIQSSVESLQSIATNEERLIDEREGWLTDPMPSTEPYTGSIIRGQKKAIDKNEDGFTDPLQDARLISGSSIRHNFISIQSFIGLYNNTFHTENNAASNYINERQKVEELLESFKIDLKYNFEIKNTNWNIGIGLSYAHDSYWLRQSFKDTLNEIFKNRPIEIIKYADQSISVSKTGDLLGKKIYTVNRRILGKRKLISIPFDIKFKWRLNLRNSIDFISGGSIGIMSIYSGKRIAKNAHDNVIENYSESIKLNKLLFSYSLGTNYTYQISNRLELTAGLQFQQEITGDEGVKLNWKEKRKYYYIGTGINVRL